MAEQPVYEVIKREDLTAAFKDALAAALLEVLERINQLIDMYSATAPSSLWVWDYTSRWDFDMWW
jgi:hypothetical protein